MTAWILLLRGINVGGSGKLPMADLRAMLVAIGCRDVATYIQSGNAVFSSDLPKAGLAEAIANAIEAGHGFRPGAFLLTEADMTAAIDGNPFPEAIDDAKPMHLIFLDGDARVDKPALDALLTATESWAMTDRVLYLRAPDGIGRSRFAERLSRHVSGVTTARNLNTCRKLLEMVRAVSGA